MRRAMVDWGQVLRFGMVGGLSTFVHVAVAYGVIQQWGWLPYLANGLAFCVATLFSYSANAVWTFSSRISPQTMRRFASVSACGLMLSMGVSHAAAACGLPDWGGIALVVLLVPPATYVLHARWTFSSPAT